MRLVRMDVVGGATGRTPLRKGGEVGLRNRGTFLDNS